VPTEGDNQSRYFHAWERAWNQGDVGALAEVMDADYVRRSSRHAVLGDAMSLGELQQSILDLRRAFPDFVTEITEIVGDDQRFGFRWRGTGRQTGTFHELPPTGRSVDVCGFTSCRFNGDRVVEEWVSYDARDLIEALGVSSLSVNAPTDRALGVETDELRAAHRNFLTGVTVVTVAQGGEQRGLVVNAFTSVSLEPPLILVCIAHSSSSHALLMRAGHFAVNVLAGDQEAVALRFGSKVPDKFDGVAWTPGVGGAPVLDGAAAVFEVITRERVSASTHTMFVGEVVAVSHRKTDALIYHGGRFLTSGQLPLPAHA
jgi:flavin reductase (DIM6/NTAB) family NADH-FMN oxidoreductase RutF/predicted ester cyclase